MEHGYEYTGTVPLDDSVALESPIAKSRLLNLCENIEVQDSEDWMEEFGEKGVVLDSEDWMEEYGEKGVVLDSDNERGEQIEATVIRRFSGRDVTGLVKGQKVPDGFIGRRLINKVIENIDRSSAGSVGCDGESCFLRTTLNTDTGNQDHPVIDYVSPGAQDLKSDSSNVKERHLDQENPNIAREHLTENLINEKGLLLDKSKAIEKVVNYRCEHAKLSYTESPESVELQAKALDFVDHYLEINDLSSSGDIEPRKTNRVKSPPSLRLKGSKSLAMRFNVGCKASKSTTFDWLERPFMQSDCTSPRNANDSTYASKGDKSRNLSINQESDDVYSQMKVSSLCSNKILAENILSFNNSDANLVYTNETDNVGSKYGVGIAYDFVKELDEQFDAGSFRKNVGKGEQGSVATDTFDVGLETQMAAEAMEALVNEASPMFNACFAHQDLDSRFIHPSSTVNKKSKSRNFFKSSEAFIGWSNKEKQSKCVKTSTVELNNTISCSKDHCSSVFDGHYPHSRTLETSDVIKSDAHRKSRKVRNFQGGVCKKGLRGKKSNFDSCFQGTNNTAKRVESYNLAVADSRLSNLWIHPKGKRFHPHATHNSNKSIKQSLCDAIDEKKAEKYRVVDEESHNRVARFLVYTRRRQLAAERKYSGSYIDLTDDLSSPSVNNNECSGRQVEIPIDTIKSSKEFCKLDDEGFSPFLDTSGVAKLDALLTGNLEPLQGCMGSDKRKQPCPVVDKEPHNRVARLLVYTRRRQSAAERKHSWNYVNLTGDLSFPSVNNSEYTGRQVEIPIDAVKLSKEFSKLDDEGLSPFLDTSGVTSLDALSNGNSDTLLGCIVSDERKQPCNLRSSSPLMKELMRLGFTESLPDFLPKDLRRRRVMDKVCILFSRNLDTKVLKQQQKIAARMGISIATFCAEATHFVTDNFVRTRNMLEAIAHGKPVVTHSWLENCEQAGYVIDEMSYILRDDKKEKEIGFSMPVSLTRARRLPLLKGHRVFITPNVKPSADLMLCLIEAVHGEAIEDIQNTLTKNSVPNDLLFLSSEEEFTICVPFLKKGASIYNSELLLNGIVVQKLEYDRHQLFKEFVGK